MKSITSLFFLLFLAANSFARFSPGNLRCEYLNNPLGIDTPDPRLSWLLEDTRYGAVQTACKVVIGRDSVAVAKGQGDIWDSGKVNSDKMLVSYTGGQLTPFTKYYWSVRVWDKDGAESQPAVATFETGMMSIENWHGAWVSDGQHLGRNSMHVRPAPYFRKEFETTKKIASARAYIAVAGLYELYINGEQIGDHRLDPMYTRFDRRNLYVTYDVTPQLQAGKNAIGVLLGNGWYNHQSIAVWYFDRAPWRDRPTFCMDLRITYEDGSVEVVRTERDWKTALSPVIFNSIYTAEHYDARLEQPGWNKVGFDDSKWEDIVYRSSPSQNIVAQQLHPIRNVEKIPVKTMTKTSDKRYVFDLGRNISGVSQIRVKGEAGTKIRLKHAEILRPNGEIDMKNVEAHYRPTDDSDPFGTDIFILSGKGEETFMPRFNYKGFQYVEVTSDKPVALTADALTGWFMHSDLPPVGRIETSNPLINKIWQAANSSYLANMFGYPTDCPHREKNGWTGDANYAVDLGLYNFDGITVYEKWLADHRDEQQPNGVFSNIIPTSGWGYDWGNGLDWTSSIAIIPWAVYEFYGDSRLLRDSYVSLKRYVNHVMDIAPTGITAWGLGDWVPIKSQTPQQYTSSIYYYRVASILAKTAQLFGETEDFAKYSALAEKIKSAINDMYLNRETGIYGSGFQTELSTALHWGIVPDELKAKVAANLAKRVEADGRHLDVGLLGTKAILHALSENGYGDLAYALAAQETFPSWGYWIAKDNATTMYEDWTAIGEKRETSLNHIMFGEVDAWFYSGLGGILRDTEQPGFKNTLLKPNFVTGLNHAKASYESPRGLIVSDWERTKKKTIVYRVTIPANSTATLSLPEKTQIKKVVVEGKGEITLAGTEKGYQLPAGKYVIHCYE
ncbi:MAG: glycoside hydrolase family 78 protein [Bacteroidales bacterium]|jgi:alpha-L-rhamnosidase|nr:glycoside hydrolase family 78 protein [Bacteroidales bacterium]